MQTVKNRGFQWKRSGKTKIYKQPRKSMSGLRYVGSEEKAGKSYLNTRFVLNGRVRQE
jgi:hypothetical protein